MFKVYSLPQNNENDILNGTNLAHTKDMEVLIQYYDKLDLRNYRPISILPATSKIIERLAKDQLMDHCKDQLHQFQSGFRPYHSTTTALLHCTNDWLLAMDKGFLVGVVFLDVSKAFDSINHQLLLQKLQSLGLQDTALDWFTSYLDSRSQEVRIEDSTSSSSSLLAGVPQGSILGPSLFSLFMNDLPDSVKSSTCAMYADDTTLYVTSDSVDSITTSLNHCLLLINTWMQENYLKLNVSKTKCMLIHPPRKPHLPPLHLSVNGTTIEQVFLTKFKRLGLYINDTLSWNEHISQIVSKVSKQIYLLRRLSDFLPQSEGFLQFLHPPHALLL